MQFLPGCSIMDSPVSRGPWTVEIDGSITGPYENITDRGQLGFVKTDNLGHGGTPRYYWHLGNHHHPSISETHPDNIYTYAPSLDAAIEDALTQCALTYGGHTYGSRKATGLFSDVEIKTIEARLAVAALLDDANTPPSLRAIAVMAHNGLKTASADLNNLSVAS